MINRRCGVFFANGLGDHLLTLPALRALVAVMPGALTLITADGPAELMFGDVGLRDIIQVPMFRPDCSAARDFSVGEVVEKLGDIDCLISLVPWHSESLSRLVEMVRPAWSIGLHSGFDFHVGTDAHQHAADRPFELVRKFDTSLSLERFSKPPTLPLDSIRAAREIRDAIGRDRRLLVVHEETASDDKRWMPCRWKRTLQSLVDKIPNLFVLVISRRPPSFDLSALGGAATAITSIALPFFLALIGEADVFLGVDSIGIHAADLWDIPAVGLFGPTRPAEWGLRFSHRGMHADGEGSMRNISVEQVVDATSHLLGV